MRQVWRWRYHCVDSHMLGKRFRLKVPTIALKQSTGKPEMTHLPQGAEILVIDRVPMLPTDDPNRQLEVECNGDVFSMFLVDLRERGELIGPPKRSGS